MLKSIPLISKTKYNNIKESDNECINTNLIYSNLTTEKEEVRGKFDLCMDDIKNKIEYENLIRYHKDSKYVIDEIVKLIFEVLMCEGDTMVIASNKYPLELVKNKFLKLDYTHIQYVLEGFNNNTTKINNIRKYMLASLFNAESTMSSYYTAQANYDLRGKGIMGGN